MGPVELIVEKVGLEAALEQYRSSPRERERERELERERES